MGVLSCEEDPKKKDKDYFKFFPEKHAERQFSFDSGNAFYITLPDCFKNARFRQFSITNEDNYHCKESQSYFSIDRFTSSDVSYYEKYFSDDSTEQFFSQELLLNYVLKSRSSNLNIHTESIFTEITTATGLEITLAAVKGSETNYSNPLYYQYGIFSLDDEFYLVQFIINEGDISFFHQDVMKVFKSIREA